MSFVTFEKGSRAKIMKAGDFYYNQDYYPVIVQHPKSGHVILNTPSGRKVYEASDLKKYVRPPGLPTTSPTKALQAPKEHDEKSDDHKAITDFFFPKHGPDICPLCGQSGVPRFQKFKCNNKDCRNNR